MRIMRTLVLAVLAGSFIAFGGVLTGTIAVGSELGTGPTRLLMGLGFTVGLFMVVMTGAELFTGNSLMTVSLFSRKLSVWALARNWDSGLHRESDRGPHRRIVDLLRRMVEASRFLLRYYRGGNRQQQSRPFFPICFHTRHPGQYHGVYGSMAGHGRTHSHR